MKLFRFGALGRGEAGRDPARRRARRRLGRSARTGTSGSSARRSGAAGGRGRAPTTRASAPRVPAGARARRRRSRARASWCASASTTATTPRETGAAIPGGAGRVPEGHQRAGRGPSDDLAVMPARQREDRLGGRAGGGDRQARQLRRRRRTRWSTSPGFALHNDYSERAFQMERGGQWTKGKSADGFAPFGPFARHRRRVAQLRRVAACGSKVNGAAQAGQQHRRT